MVFISVSYILVNSVFQSDISDDVSHTTEETVTLEEDVDLDIQEGELPFPYTYEIPDDTDWYTVPEVGIIALD